MRVSVIIVNFNGRHHLEHCLAALMVQRQLPDQVILVDNGSTDGSADFVRIRYPEVDIVLLSENRGFTGGNIAGFEVATGELVVLLNNDTRPCEDWLSELAGCAERMPEVGIVASHITDWEGRYTDSAGDGCTVTGRGYKLAHARSVAACQASGYVFSACGGAALYKRSMLEEIGFLEPSFFMNAEDTDLAFRALLAGWKVYFCAEARVRHRIGASQKVLSQQHVFYSTRNHIWLALRCMPLRLLIKYGPAHLLQVLVYLGYFIRERRAMAYLRGLLAAIGGTPRALSQRKEIQRTLCVTIDSIEAQLTPFGEFLSLKRREAREPR